MFGNGITPEQQRWKKELLEESDRLRNKAAPGRDFSNLPELSSLNPTGTVFTSHDPSARANAPLGGTLTTLAATTGHDPDDLVLVYRGVPKDAGSLIQNGGLHHHLPGTCERLRREWKGDTDNGAVWRHLGRRGRAGRRRIHSAAERGCGTWVAGLKKL